MSEIVTSPELARQRAETDLIVGLSAIHVVGGYEASNATVRG